MISYKDTDHAINVFFASKANLTKVFTFRCRKVNRNIKFDCDKSSLAFSIRLGKAVDQQPS